MPVSKSPVSKNPVSKSPASKSPTHTFQSDVGVLERVLVRHPRAAFVDQATIDSQWKSLYYAARPDFSRALEEYEAFLEQLTSLGATAIEIQEEPGTLSGVGIDSLYPRDASIATDRGLILCRMGKPARAGEPELTRATSEGLGLPIRGVIGEPGTLEGGDVAWLDERTCVVARGYRTNDAGIAQLRVLLGESVDELIVVPSPHWRGPEDVFHLMSIWSPIDRDLALVYSPLMSVPFRELLLERGTQLVEVPDEEFDSLGCNCLALAPRVCLLPNGNPETKRRLEAAGVEVRTFDGSEICLKGCGGPTCLTRPLERSI